MNEERFYKRAAIAVLILMSIFLPILAYYQYQWIGQISEEEYNRMKAHVEIAAFNSAMELNREFADLFQFLLFQRFPFTPLSAEQIQKNIQDWQQVSEHAPLLSSSVTVVPFPTETGLYPLFFQRQQQVIFLAKDLSAFYIPLSPSYDRMASFSLNRKYLFSSLLPRIFSKQFSMLGDGEYELRVTDSYGNTVFSSINDTTQKQWLSFDVVQPLLRFFPRGPVPFTVPPSVRKKMPTARNGQQEQYRRNVPERREEVTMPRQEPPPPREEVLQEMPVQGLLTLHIRHRSGSLQEFVAVTRWRNLGISFGILVLLGSSVIFLFLAAHRARKLAQQQMGFLASISHEFRTPLAVVASAGDNLAEGAIHESQRVQQYGELIRQHARRLSEMVEHTLAFSKLQSGTLSFEYELLDTYELLQSAFHELRLLIAPEHYTITVHIPENIPAIRGDKLFLRIALVNVLTNAVKYSLGKASITLKATVEQVSDSKYLTIQISDKGVGIPSREIRSIFTPFYRGTNASSLSTHGAGLGLSIVQHVIEAHDGLLDVESTVGVGTTVTIKLPTARTEEISNGTEEENPHH